MKRAGTDEPDFRARQPEWHQLEVFVNTALFRFAGQSESPTPEPASVLLLGAGIIAVVRQFKV